MTTQEAISQPFNWTGLSFLELVAAGRIVGDNRKKGIESLADKILKEKLPASEKVDVQEYLKQRKSLIAEIESELAK
jgi:hypothetical protein